MGYDFYIVQRDEAEQELVRKLSRQVTEACNRRDALPKEARGEWAEGEMEALAASGKHPYDFAPANRTAEYTQAQAEVERLAAARDAAERSYFRLNVWGMGRYRDVMLGLGVARVDYDGPAWPEFDKTRTCWIVEVDEKSDLSEQNPMLKKGERVLHRKGTKVIDPDQWYYDWREEPKYRSDDYVEPTPDVVKLFVEHQAKIEATKQWRPDPQEDFRIPIHKFGSNDGWLVTPEECFFAGNTLKTIRDAETERFYTVLGAAGIQEEEARRYFDQWIEYLLLAAERGGFEVH